MKKILKEWNEFLLLEKSMSRMLQHIQGHDTAFVTAYRNDPTDFTKCMPSHSQNPDNKERNKELKSSLFDNSKFFIYVAVVGPLFIDLYCAELIIANSSFV